MLVHRISCHRFIFKSYSKCIVRFFKQDVSQKPLPEPATIQKTYDFTPDAAEVQKSQVFLDPVLDPCAIEPLRINEEKGWNSKKPLSPRLLFKDLLSLGKIRLTGLVVLTAFGGYLVAPGTFSYSVIGFTVLGTTLTSMSANSLNQLFEVPYDSQMSRTQSRPLVRGSLSPLQGLTFGIFAGISGVSILYYFTNPITAFLGFSTLALYAGCYTPLKRSSVINTWLGAVVGGIPPVMGWTAATGSVSLQALAVGALLFSWQMPHFNALSWNLRSDYSRAGYRMMAVTDPNLCKRVAFRHTLYLIPICTSLYLSGVTTWTFAIDSLPINIWFAFLGWRFYRDGNSSSARKLFRFSLLHLPLVFLFMIVAKNPSNEQSLDVITAMSLLGLDGVQLFNYANFT